MDNQTNVASDLKKAMRFPVGAIFMLLAAALQIKNMFGGWGFYIGTAFSTLVLIATAVLFLMKKRDVVTLIPVAILALLNFGLSLHFLPRFAAYLCLALLLLGSMGVEQLKKFQKPIFIVLIVAVSVAFIVLCVQLWDGWHPLWFLKNIAKNIHLVFEVIALILLGRWVIDPYKKENPVKENGSAAQETRDEYYISLGKHICLLLFTCGIWQLIWIYKVTKYTNLAKGEDYRNPTSKLLLCIFVPFYLIYWTYKTALRIDNLAKERNIASELGTICLILAIFVGFVPPILMQEKVNSIVSGSGKKMSSSTDNTDALVQYKQLLDQGVITQEEFDAKKKELLGL